MKARYHLLEFGEREVGHMRVTPRRRKKGDRIVSPVIGQAFSRK